METAKARVLDTPPAMLILGTIGLATGVFAGRRLDSTSCQNLWLGALCILLAPVLIKSTGRNQGAIIALLTAAGLTIASNALSPEADSIDLLVVILVGIALLPWTQPADLVYLIPGSAISLVMVLLASAWLDQPVSPPVIQSLATAVAAIAAGFAFGRARFGDPAFWVPAICAMSAATTLVAVSLQGSRLSITIAILFVGAAELLRSVVDAKRTTLDGFASLPSAPEATLALVASTTGVAILFVATMEHGAFSWQIVGAAVVGIAGLMALARMWWMSGETRRRLFEFAVVESRTDVLTGIANRRGIEEQLDNEIARSLRFSHPLSVLIIDLDDFKAINDRFGHSAGDDALRSTARLIEQSIRSIDRAGRYGGEEFLVILPETGETGALVVAERIRASVANSGVATVSVGLSSLDESQPSQALMIDSADRALYLAKQSGKNRIASAI